MREGREGGKQHSERSEDRVSFCDIDLRVFAGIRTNLPLACYRCAIAYPLYFFGLFIVNNVTPGLGFETSIIGSFAAASASGL
jgi:hypothetical protein